MHKHNFNRLFRSVFFRLLAAIAVAGILMTMTVVVGFFSVQRAMFDNFQQNFAQYVRYLLKDIGDPPDLVKARAIAAQTGLVIHFKSPHEEWTIPEGASIPSMREKRRVYRTNTNSKVNIGSGREGHFISVMRADGRLTFWQLRNEKFERQNDELFLTVGLILLLILFGAYLYIRRVMQPVHWLTAAMIQYGDGHLDYRMPLKRSDEFQDLAESVNRMAGRIQALLESKEKLLLDVSHELRSPIARLKVGIEMLTDKEAKDSLREDLVEMEAMVTGILEAARLRQSNASLNLQKVSSTEFISSVVAEFKNAPVPIQLGSIHECEVSMDSKKMRIVLKNVLDNALKYSNGSRQPVEVTATRGEACFEISVQDHGIGIPKEDLHRVFAPFFRVDLSRSRETGGYGLGLSLCKAIMEAHGGKISIESELGRGTRVAIQLPLA